MAETITLAYSAGNFSQSRSVPNGTGTRVVAATKARLGLAANATNAQVFTALADEFFKSVMQNVVNHEREQARKTADATVSDIPLT